MSAGVPTGTGVWEPVIMAPLPKLPNELSPQQYAVAFESRAQVWYSPAATAIASRQVPWSHVVGHNVGADASSPLQDPSDAELTHCELQPDSVGTSSTASAAASASAFPESEITVVTSSFVPSSATLSPCATSSPPLASGTTSIRGA